MWRNLFFVDRYSIYILICALGGVALQVLAFTTMLKIISSIEKASPVSLFFFSVEIKGVEQFIGYFSIVIVFFLMSAAFLYLSQRIILYKTEMTEKKIFNLSRSLLQQYSLPVYMRTLTVPWSSFKTRSVRLPRPIGRIAMIYYGSQLNLAKFLLFGGAAFWSSFYNSVFVMLAFTVAGFFYLKHAKQGRVAANDMFETNALSSKERMQLLDDELNSLEIGFDIDSSGPITDKNMRSYFDGFKFVKKNEFVSNIFKAVGFAIVGVLISRDIFVNGNDVVSSLSYLFFLQMSLTGLQAVVTAMSSMNRYYPLVVEYMELIKSHDGFDRVNLRPSEELNLSALISSDYDLSEKRTNVKIPKDWYVSLYVHESIKSNGVTAGLLTAINSGPNWDKLDYLSWGKFLKVEDSLSTNYKLKEFIGRVAQPKSTLVVMDHKILAHLSVTDKEAKAFFPNVALVFVYRDPNECKQVSNGFMLVNNKTDQILCIQGIDKKRTRLPELIVKYWARGEESNRNDIEDEY
jgi:hypothetical protein